MLLSDFFIQKRMKKEDIMNDAIQNQIYEVGSLLKIYKRSSSLRTIWLALLLCEVM